MIKELYFVAAYFVGAIPTGFWFGKALKGIDVREHGSGNMGATNVIRVLGMRPGLAVLAIDIAKGVVAVTLLAGWFGVENATWIFGGGVIAIIGHNYTCFLNFKGGKGVATSAGIVIGLAPHSAGVIFIIFLVTLALTRMVSVGSLVCATLLPFLTWYFDERGEGNTMLYLGIVICVFIWIKHKDNIKRIMAGTENKFSL